MKNVRFCGQYLSRALAGLGVKASDDILVAVSGGGDSLALLHAMSSLGWRSVRAIHVDHGLHRQASAWGSGVQAAATSMGVPCEVVRVTVARTGEGPEADARAARYRVLSASMRPGEVLVTAHHADDQAETVLLRLLRGAGLAGLSAMAGIRAFGPGRLARPLLAVPKAALAAYAAEHALAFVHDPSNDDTRYARNYIRHALVPVITARWPRAVESINRAARHARSAEELLSAYLAQDVAACSAPDGALRLPVLHALAPRLQGAVLRAWLSGQGGPPMSEAKGAEVLAALAMVPRSRRQVLRFGRAGVLRRYRERAVWTPGDHETAAPVLPKAWPPPFRDLSLSDGRRLRAVPAVGQGVAAARIADRPLVVATRTFGQRVFVPGRGHRALKKLLQEMGMAPWERSRAVLIYADEALIAVAGHWMCASFTAGPGEPGFVFHIES
ncbi:MAG: tRNA lysidine(34) synthetase TilS [Acidiferrobacter thiooxydans]